MTDQFDEGHQEKYRPTPESESADSEQLLRAMLAGLDPMSARVPLDSPTSPRARHLLEQIMTSTPTTEPVVAKVSFLRRPRTFLAAAASVAVLALGTAVAVNAGGDGAPLTPENASTLALSAPGGDPTVIMSCLMFDVAGLRMMPVAFGGTVTDLTPDQVTVDVDRWFKGGDADRVTIALPPGNVSPALIPGVDFVKGERFLITAAEGTVNGCGFSGPATADYEKSFTEAFPG
ncbi:MAG: hypothetical protein ACT4P1_04560 [Sporichthyaceae bacterium]